MRMEDLPHLPEVTAKACIECPWRRDATPGHLGPHSAADWIEAAHGEGPIFCHMTIKDVDENGVASLDDPALKQCAGAAQFRTNVLKSPRDGRIAVALEVDTTNVFTWNADFLRHHLGQDAPDHVCSGRYCMTCYERAQPSASRAPEVKIRTPRVAEGGASAPREDVK